MTQPPDAERILLIDFGSQFTQLIARRVRESGVYCEIAPCHALRGHLDPKPAAVILSGGPASAAAGQAGPPAPPELFQLGVPILGICYGQQAMCAALGGRAAPGEAREFGRARITIAAASPLFDSLAPPGGTEDVWMSHADRVVELPKGFVPLAHSGHAPYAAIADERRKLYGVQFHPEVVHTPGGAKLIENFARRIANCAGRWTMQAFLDQAAENIRARAPKGRILCALSGGVDSAATALLLHRAVGERLVCIFVDNGLLRENEAEDVTRLFREHFNIPLIAVDAADRFLAALGKTSGPEEKRKIIGKLFIKIFEEEAKKIGNAQFLAQGTLYPDVIESVSAHGGPSATIKSHHNVGGLPKRMKLKLIEPVRDLFKDEVRALGRTLGLPETFLRRHPFPGPGLAVRIPGPVTAEKCRILRRADAIYIDEIRKHKLYDHIWQAFAVLLPVKSVGVMGDARSYEYVCALRAVTSVDGMTADAFPFPPNFLEQTATRIINETKGINRVVYDVTSKPPGTIEWE